MSVMGGGKHEFEKAIGQELGGAAILPHRFECGRA
jgi:hypothetical protein